MPTEQPLEPDDATGVETNDGFIAEPAQSRKSSVFVGSPADCHRQLAALAKEIAKQCSHSLGRAVLVRPGMTAWRTCGQFWAGVEQASCCYAFQPSASVNDTAPSGWVELSPSLAMLIVEGLLGGRGGESPIRPLTGLERRLLHRPAAAVASAVGRACGDGEAFVVREQPLEAPAPAQSQCDSSAVIATFELTMGGQAGLMRLCLGGPGESQAAAQPAGGLLEMSASIPEVGIQPDELAGLSGGDILMTETATDGEVILRVAGIPKFIGRLVICNGHRAVTILRRIN